GPRGRPLGAARSGHPIRAPRLFRPRIGPPPRPRPRGPIVSRRSDQFGAELTRAVQEVLARGLQDPRVSGLITVTGVNVTENLSDATVSVSVLPEDRQELTLHGLRGAAA